MGQLDMLVAGSIAAERSAAAARDADHRRIVRERSTSPHDRGSLAGALSWTLGRLRPRVHAPAAP